MPDDSATAVAFRATVAEVGLPARQVAQCLAVFNRALALAADAGPIHARACAMMAAHVERLAEDA